MVEELRLNNLQSVDDRATELLSNYSYSSTFIQQSIKLLLDQTEISSDTPDYPPETPTYVAPEERYMRLSEDFLIVADSLLGHCKKIGSQSQTTCKRLGRSHSLVELPVFTGLSGGPPSERYSHMSESESESESEFESKSSSTALSFLTSSGYRSATELDFRGSDQRITEVCLCTI